MLPPEVIYDAVIVSNLVALLSIGLTLTYMTLKVPNFAHGDLATIGAYVAITAYELAGANPYLMMPLAFLVPAAYSLATYLLVYKPLWRRGANVVTMMVASIALEVATRSGMHVYADVMREAYKTYFRGVMFDDVYLPLGGLRVPGVLLTSTLTAFAMTLALYLFLTRTKFGVAMRAAIENPSLASTLGIDVEKVYAFSWFLAGGLAGLAGVFMPFRVPTDPEVGWLMLLKVFAASILGGLESVFGAVLGGYIIGVTEVVGIYALSKPPISISTAYRPAIPFAILILTLLFCPKGITGVNWRSLLRRGEER